jgi:hypothetical protein
MMSKTAAEYIRRKKIRTGDRNYRESGSIRYKNQNTILTKQEEAPGMGDFLPLKNNRPVLKSEN